MRGRGFTLIEMAVVIAILSLISVALLGVFSSLRTNTALAKTRNNHDAIYQALVRFAANNGRLPCPAPFAVPPTNASYGAEEAGVEGVCVDGPPDALIFPAPNNEYAVGNVPFRTLGLGPEERFDGWNHQFTYVVAIAATDLDRPARAARFCSTGSRGL